MRRMPKRLTLEMLERIGADAVMVNLSLVVALTARFLFLFCFRGGTQGASLAFYTELLQASVRVYLGSFWLLTPICLVTFYLSGFYTYGRAYRGRYKALLILQAVSVSYLLFAFATYFFSPLTPVPRSVLLSSYALSVLLVGGLRVGSALWRRATWAEASIWGRPGRRAIHNVTVIGGAGYIGSVLVRKLLERGYRVTVLDALVYGDASLRDLHGRDGFEFVHGDMRNIEDVVEALQYADAVVHLGALVGDPACALDEKLTLEINLAATRMIAEAARGFGVQRFVFASTCSVYGASDQVLDERSALKPVSLYARTKIASEKALLGLNEEHFAPVILRFATVYGLSPRPRFDLVVNLLAAKAACEGSISIFGGDQWRPFVHVDDAAEAIIRCLEAPLHAVRGQVFNVGSDQQNYQIAQLGDLIGNLVPGVEVVRQDKDVDQRNYHVSFSKIRKQLGFTTHHTVAGGILEIKAALEEGRIRDYRETHYSNYKTLSDEANARLIRHTRVTPLYGGSLDEEQMVAALPAAGASSSPQA